jgi:hypothetical protein
MNKRQRNWILELILIAMLALTIITAAESAEVPQPTPPGNITVESNYTYQPGPVKSLNTSGGSFSIITINSTTQTPRWKAFLGNVTGKIGLWDGSNNSVYDWDLEVTTGEIYTTRNPSTIDWSGIECANISHIYNEEINLSINTSDEDSINNTFNTASHEAFYTASTYWEANECLGIATNINNARQTANFQEVLLYSDNYLIYTGLLEDGEQGYNGKYYDFQVIVPNDAQQGKSINTLYYFYLELV